MQTLKSVGKQGKR